MELQISKRVIKKPKLIVNYDKKIVRNENKPLVRMVNEPNELGDNAVRDVIKYFQDHYEISSIDVLKDELVFKTESKELALKGYKNYWDIINGLINSYDNNRGCFYSSNKGINKIVVIPDSKTEFKKVEDWLVFRVCLVGATSIDDSNFLKYLTKDIYSELSVLPDKIKLADTTIDEIDLGTLTTVEIGDYLVAYDSSLSKYFFDAYKNRLEQRGVEEDTKHGIKQYEIKHRGVLNVSSE